MKFCLTTLYDENFNSFSSMVVHSFKEFCKINDFDLVVYTKLFDESIHPSWNKLLAIKKCFETYDCVLWCDADSLFVKNQTIFLQSLNLDEDFITNSDSNGICLSHFLMKNTQYNQDLINTLLFLKDVKDDSKFGIGNKWEQNALKALLQNFNIKHKTFNEHTVVDYIWHNKLYSNTFFYHFSNLDNKIRYSLIKLIFEKDYQHV